MPYFFQFTKNGRRECNVNKSYLNPNDSTMNRICGQFDNISRLNMNTAGVNAFNYKMLLDKDITHEELNNEAINIFIEYDSMKHGYSLNVKDRENLYVEAEGVIVKQIKDWIELAFRKANITLEEAQRSITYALFHNEDSSRTAHKQMYWKLFGEITERNIINNLRSSTVCDRCGTNIPAWEHHMCRKTSGTVECIDCGKIFTITNPKQKRCECCQKEHRKINRHKKIKDGE